MLRTYGLLRSCMQTLCDTRRHIVYVPNTTATAYSSMLILYGVPSPLFRSRIQLIRFCFSLRSSFHHYTACWEYPLCAMIDRNSRRELRRRVARANRYALLLSSRLRVCFRELFMKGRRSSSFLFMQINGS